ncbi:MAG: hypothetical protein J0I12_28430 [Candidatus Eremiobacteraeota bacterium]|nr:hypothetical protein [Candidatus Eremiobacteraeota bacterium]
MKQWIFLCCLSLAAAAEPPWSVNGLRLGDPVSKKPRAATHLSVNQDRDFHTDPDLVIVDARNDKLIQISGAELEFHDQPILRFNMPEDEVLKALAARGPLYDMGGSYAFLPPGLDLVVTMSKGKLLRLILVPPIGARPSQTIWQKIEVVKGKLVRRPAISSPNQEL